MPAELAIGKCDEDAIYKKPLSRVKTWILFNRIQVLKLFNYSKGKTVSYFDRNELFFLLT